MLSTRHVGALWDPYFCDTPELPVKHDITMTTVRLLILAK